MQGFDPPEVAEVKRLLSPSEPETFRNYKEERKGRTVNVYGTALGPVKHQVVPMCGHKFISGHEPRHTNCEPCWFTFFQVHGELTQSLDEVYAKFGESGLRQLKSAKYVKNFLKFMSTIAQWKKAADAAKEKDVEDSIAAASGYSGHTAASGAGEKDGTAEEPLQ